MCKMNGNLTLMSALVVCISMIFLRTKNVCGIDTGTVDPDCLDDCACCKNRYCGPHGYWPEGNCYSGCIDGYRGARCVQKCDYPECAQCPDMSYVCTKCKAGYYPGSSNNCSSTCPFTCKTCTSSTYCTECTDEYYSANGFNDCRYRSCPSHCICEPNVCVSCKDGHFNISSSCISKCPSTCVTCSAKDKCNSCGEGKYNGYEFDMTDRLLLNNCTHGCRGNCITCSSYNKCLQCKPGKYGMTCQNDCSDGCKNKLCQIESGNCKCKNNFSGQSCTDCVSGNFGALCEKTCPLFCKLPPKSNFSRCESKHGKCFHACVDGYFGPVCNKSCSSQCIDNMCMQDDGKCTRGCYRPSDDPVCYLSSENPKSEDSRQTAVIVMEVIIALLLVVVICLIACIIVLKRQLINSLTGSRVSSRNESSSSNIEHRRNEEQTSSEQHAVYYNVTENTDNSCSEGIPQTSEYEKVKSIQVPEHEYGHISSAV